MISHIIGKSKWIDYCGPNQKLSSAHDPPEVLNANFINLIKK